MLGWLFHWGYNHGELRDVANAIEDAQAEIRALKEFAETAIQDGVVEERARDKFEQKYQLLTSHLDYVTKKPPMIGTIESALQSPEDYGGLADAYERYADTMKEIRRQSNELAKTDLDDLQGYLEAATLHDDLKDLYHVIRKLDYLSSGLQDEKEN